MGSSPKKLLDQVREAIRIKHYSYRTEKTYMERRLLIPRAEGGTCSRIAGAGFAEGEPLFLCCCSFCA